MKPDRICITAYVPSQVEQRPRKYAQRTSHKTKPRNSVLEQARAYKASQGSRFVDGIPVGELR